MYNIDTIVAAALDKERDNFPLNFIEKTLLKQYRRRVRTSKVKFEATHILLGYVQHKDPETGEDIGPVLTKKGQKVPIYGFTGWDFGKKPQYRKDRLKKARQERTIAAVEAHEAAGLELPVPKDRFIDGDPKWYTA